MAYCFTDFTHHGDFNTLGIGVDTGQWIMDDIGTSVSSGSIVSLVNPNGLLIIDAGTAASTGIQLFQYGTNGVNADGTGAKLFLQDTGFNNVTFAWEARVKSPDVSLGTSVVGQVVDTFPAIGTDGVMIVTDGLYFHCATTGVITATAERGSNITNGTVVGTMEDDVFITLGMRGRTADVTSDTAEQWVEVYINGVRTEVLQDATNGVVPTAELHNYFAAVNAAGPYDFEVDYIWTAYPRIA